ncbi:MAG: sugar phosphate isomerase/epimerase [Candidatus Anammoximicrobium sp.]|nr:sugar phosphate isomerase/epimerase [Candidatus Anammoximicrobium sp.]
MLQLRIGIPLSSLRLPFRQALAKAAALGADAVEIDARREINPQELTPTGIREIRKLLEDQRLRVCAIDFPTRFGYNVLDGLDRRVEATKQAMSVAFKLGAAVVVNNVGRVPESEEDPDWTLLVETLSDLGRHGQRVGATLAARTGAESGEELARLVKSLPAGSLGVDFDPGSLIVNGYSPREALTALAPYVLHVHARDAARDLAQGRGIETPLGEGAVDFPELLGILEEHQYRGYLTIESQTSGNPEVEIATAVRYLKNLFA